MDIRRRYTGGGDALEIIQPPGGGWDTPDLPRSSDQGGSEQPKVGGVAEPNAPGQWGFQGAVPRNSPTLPQPDYHQPDPFQEQIARLPRGPLTPDPQYGGPPEPTTPYTPPRAVPRFGQPQAPAPPAAPQPTGPAPWNSGSGSFRDWFMGLLSGKPFNQQTLLELEGVLGQSGSRLTPANSIGERTKIWDPSINDWVRVGFGEGHPVWIPQGWGSAGPGAHVPGVSQGHGEFQDPWASSFEQEILRRLKALETPKSNPVMDELMKRLQEADVKKQEQTQAYVGSLRSRIGELNQDPYTTSQEQVLRTKAFDQLERRRQQTLKNRREELFMRGHAPTSGTIAEAEQDTHTDFEGVRGGIESDLLKSSIDEGQRRKDRATQLEGFIADALGGADLQSLQYLSGAADLEDKQYMDRESRQREILATYAPILDLISSRAQLLNQSAGLGGNPNSMVSSLMGLMGMGNQSAGIGRNYGNSGNANNMAGLAQLAAMLPGLFGSGGATQNQSSYFPTDLFG